MVLSGPSVPSIFPTSDAYADGFGGSIVEKRILQGDKGPSQITLLHTGFGTETSTTEVEMNSIQIGAGTLTEDEELYLIVKMYDASTDNPGDTKINFADSAGNVSTIDILTNHDTNMAILHVSQQRVDTTNLEYFGYHQRTDGLIPFGGVANLTDEKVITTALTISIRGNTHTGGIIYYSWWIYKRGLQEVA